LLKRNNFFKTILFSAIIAGILIGYSNSVCAFTITPTAGEHGKIDPAKQVQVNAGQNITFNMIPDPGYIVENVSINGFEIGAVSSWTFDPVNGDYTIHVTFRLKEVKWVNVSGTVTLEYDTPLCTMVLANGQYMFTCDENQGIYNLKVPLNDKGEITLFCFCDGQAPFKKENMTSQEAADFDIVMYPVSQDDKRMELSYEIGEAVKNPDWVKISGTVMYGETPLCTMVLANGEYMFTCDENQGKYEMEIPLDKDGNITLFGFGDDFLQFKKIFKP